MSVLDQLSSYVGEKGNVANIALARRLAQSDNSNAINELIAGLQHSDKRIRHDCIKVLYELGYGAPKAIAPYSDTFVGFLEAKDNRMVWGSMIALSTIVTIDSANIFKQLQSIKQAISKGSTITIDNGVRILAKLNQNPAYRFAVEQFLLDILWNCPIKQLPMYAQLCKESLDKQNSELFRKIFSARLPECEKESQTKRLEKILKAI